MLLVRIGLWIEALALLTLFGLVSSPAILLSDAGRLVARVTAVPHWALAAFGAGALFLAGSRHARREMPAVYAALVFFFTIGVAATEPADAGTPLLLDGMVILFLIVLPIAIGAGAALPLVRPGPPPPEPPDPNPYQAPQVHEVYSPERYDGEMPVVRGTPGVAPLGGLEAPPSRDILGE